MISLGRAWINLNLSVHKDIDQGLGMVGKGVEYDRKLGQTR